MNGQDRPGGLARALVFSSVGNLIIPLVGLATAPLLARALGVDGRGALAAAVAPAILIISVGTLGLPQAVTFWVARIPSASRRVLKLAAALTAGFGLLTCVGISLLSPWLAGGRPELIGPMIIANALAFPALFVNLLRAVASGLQAWALTAIERLVGGLSRLAVLLVLFGLGRLDLITSLLILCSSPIFGGLAYVAVLRRSRQTGSRSTAAAGESSPAVRTNALLSFGIRAWSGSIASILLARLDQALFASASSVTELGVYVVAVTVGDSIYLLVGAIADSLFGVASRTSDTDSVARVTRMTSSVVLVVALVFGASLPLWIEPVFGEGFAAAIIPTWLLLLACWLQVAGNIGGVGMSAFGRPGGRSLALAVALVFNLTSFFLFTPAMGAVGAALAMVVASLAMSLTVLVQLRLMMGLRARDVLLLRREDLAVLRMQSRALLRRGN